MQIESITEYQPKVVGITIELDQEQALYVLYCLGVNSQPDKLYTEGGSHLYSDLFEHLKNALGVSDDEVYNLSCLAAGKPGQTIGETSLAGLFT